MKKTYTNKEAEAIEFLKSIGYQFNPKERHFFPCKKEITETYPLDFLKERLFYNDMLHHIFLHTKRGIVFTLYLYAAVVVRLEIVINSNTY